MSLHMRENCKIPTTAVCRIRMAAGAFRPIIFSFHQWHTVTCVTMQPKKGTRTLNRSPCLIMTEVIWTKTSSTKKKKGECVSLFIFSQHFICCLPTCSQQGGDQCLRAEVLQTQPPFSVHTARVNSQAVHRAHTHTRCSTRFEFYIVVYLFRHLLIKRSKKTVTVSIRKKILL